jgi:hypothetical protein
VISKIRLSGFLLCAVIAALAYVPQASALVEVGVLGAFNSSSMTTDATCTSYGSKQGYTYGVLGLVSLFPGLKVRSGVLWKERNLEWRLTPPVTPIAVSIDLKDKTLDIPVNLQVDFPVIPIYLFGGVIISSTQSSTCSISVAGSTCTVSPKTKDDLLVNLGAGWNVIDIPTFKFSLEGGYEMGTVNLAPSTSSSTNKYSGYNLGLFARVGF